jgi:hypothetical protein
MHFEPPPTPKKEKLKTGVAKREIWLEVKPTSNSCVEDTGQNDVTVFFSSFKGICRVS